MTRSIKALSSAAMLAALALPTVASAQDTSSTGGRVTRDSASGHSMSGMRFDASQAVTLTNVSIVRIDSTGGGQSGWKRDDKKAGDAAGAMGTAGSMGSTGTSGSTGTTGMGATASAMSQEAGASKGQPVSAIVRSGTDSMTIVLAPSEYLASKQLTLNAGDVISVKGVRVAAGASGMGTGAGMTTILATEISKGSTMVPLRDKTTGAPSWGTMGADAAKNRGSMTPPPATKDTNSTTPPVRVP